MITEILSMVLNYFARLFTILANRMIRRSQDVILFGGKNGTFFSGDTRFLFQYCAQNSVKLGFSHVIWMTRSDEIYVELKNMGYECYMTHSLEGLYWHLRAGICVTCGSYRAWRGSNGKTYPDVATRLTYGAKCIELPHTNFWPKKNKAQLEFIDSCTGIKRLFLKAYYAARHNEWFYTRFMMPGSWGNRILAGNAIVLSRNDDKNKVEIGRVSLCPCIRYTSSESTLIGMLDQHSKILLYTPTYRKHHSIQYIPPLDDPFFCRFLKENNLFWIEKLHPNSSADMMARYYDPEYSLLLNPSFDLNVINERVDLFITDYSSTYQKAIWYYKPYAFYAPDLEWYNRYDIGINSQFDQFVGNGFCPDLEKLSEDIQEKLNEDYVVKYKASYDKWRNEFFDVLGTDYETICMRLFSR